MLSRGLSRIAHRGKERKRDGGGGDISRARESESDIMETDTETDIRTGGQRDTEIQTGGRTDRQTDRQTDGHGHRHNRPTDA